MGKVATSPLPYRGDPPLQSGRQNQKWPISGKIGHLTPAVSGSPTASERGAKSEVAHKWANWLPHPCRNGEPHRHQSGGQNQKWPTSGQSGYLTPAVSGRPTAPERAAKSEVAHKWANWPPHPCRIGEVHHHQSGQENQKWPTSGQIGYLTPAVSGSPTASERGAKSEVAHKWANWLPHPCRIGEPHRHQSGGQNQKWPTSGQIGYLTAAVSGRPTAAQRAAKSQVAHKWANWLPHPCRIGEPHRCRAGGKIRSGPQVGKLATSPCRIGEPHRFRAGGKIRSGPQVGKLATSPLPYRGDPWMQSGRQNQKWPTSGQIGYLTPAVLGSPTATRARGKIRSGPLVGKLATSPLPYQGAPPLQSGGQNQKWPTSGQIGYLGPAVSGSPTASERGVKSEVAHKWANWLPHPCRIGEPHRHQNGGQNQKWPTSGQIGYLTPAVSGSPTASERGAKSEVAHKWANWLPHPCRIGEPHRFRAGGKIRSGPQLGKLATSSLPYRGAPPLQSGGQN